MSQNSRRISDSDEKLKKCNMNDVCRFSRDHVVEKIGKMFLAKLVKIIFWEMLEEVSDNIRQI